LILYLVVTVHSPEEGPQGFIFPLFFLGVLMAQAPNFLSSLVIHPFAATLGHILWEQGVGKGGFRTSGQPPAEPGHLGIQSMIAPFGVLLFAGKLVKAKPRGDNGGGRVRQRCANGDKRHVRLAVLPKTLARAVP
jgi:hypothetical protein